MVGTCLGTRPVTILQRHVRKSSSTALDSLPPNKNDDTIEGLMALFEGDDDFPSSLDSSSLAVDGDHTTNTNTIRPPNSTNDNDNDATSAAAATTPSCITIMVTDLHTHCTFTGKIDMDTVKQGPWSSSNNVKVKQDENSPSSLTVLLPWLVQCLLGTNHHHSPTNTPPPNNINNNPPVEVLKIVLEMQHLPSPQEQEEKIAALHHIPQNNNSYIQIFIKERLSSGLFRNVWKGRLVPKTSSPPHWMTSLLGSCLNQQIYHSTQLQQSIHVLNTQLQSWKETATKLDVHTWQQEKDDLFHRFLILLNQSKEKLQKAHTHIDQLTLELQEKEGKGAPPIPTKRNKTTKIAPSPSPFHHLDNNNHHQIHKADQDEYDTIQDDVEPYDTELVKRLAAGKTLSSSSSSSYPPATTIHNDRKKQKTKHDITLEEEIVKYTNSYQTKTTTPEMVDTHTLLWNTTTPTPHNNSDRTNDTNTKQPSIDTSLKMKGTQTGSRHLKRKREYSSNNSSNDDDNNNKTTNPPPELPRKGKMDETVVAMRHTSPNYTTTTTTTAAAVAKQDDNDKDDSGMDSSETEYDSDEPLL